jgi:hypothetical protein
MVRKLLQRMGYVVKERDWYIESSWINVQLWQAVANATNKPFGLAICARNKVSTEQHVCFVLEHHLG